MKSRFSQKTLAFGIAFTTGTLVSVSLLALIGILTHYRNHTVEQRPLLVLDLMALPKPVKTTKPAAQTAPMKNANIAKKSPKPSARKTDQHAKKVEKEKPLETMETNLPEEVVMEPQKSVKPEQAQPATLVPTQALDDPSPTPAPIFTLTQLPRFLHREKLIYPEIMRADGLSGIVRLEALIDKKGHVREVSILNSAGRDFDAEAKRAILSSSFYPAKIENKPVAVLLRLPVKFNLY